MEPPETLSAPEGLLEEEIEPSPLSLLLHDHALLGLAILALLGNLSLLVYLLSRFDVLPDPLPLHFDAAGLPDRIEARSGILALPAIGLVVLFLNAALGVVFHRRERAATFLLAASATAVQLLMWLAVINITGGPI